MVSKQQRINGCYMKLEGLKFDTEKVDLSLLPSTAIIEVGKVLTYGKHKYGAHNWRKGILFSRNIAAALRHIFKWISGTSYDEESGCHHLAHACVDLLFILEYAELSKHLDDRYINEDRTSTNSGS